jgi:threonine aldolase
MKAMIDLRSDTVTRPTAAMLDAMFRASVGDDIFDEDPTVNALQQKAAAMFGKEAALFCPSGTMTNQIALKVLTQPLQEVICDRQSHIYVHEGGGLMFHSGLSVHLVNGSHGKITDHDVAAGINPSNIHQPQTSVVAIENTHNRGGGSYYTLAEAKAIAAEARSHQLKTHLDGARIFNALAITGEDPLEWGELFDTISVCLSKGLGAPVGSVLLSSHENIQYTKRIRKVMGGAMRQAGYLAAAGIYALENNISRLHHDHARAKILGSELSKCLWIKELLPVHTNIVVFTLDDKLKQEEFLSRLQAEGILAVAFGRQTVRMVTHLDFNDQMLDKVTDVLKKF